jgi:hypothetical protein
VFKGFEIFFHFSLVESEVSIIRVLAFLWPPIRFGFTSPGSCWKTNQYRWWSSRIDNVRVSYSPKPSIQHFHNQKISAFFFQGELTSKFYLKTIEPITKIFFRFFSKFPHFSRTVQDDVNLKNREVFRDPRRSNWSVITQSTLNSRNSQGTATIFFRTWKVPHFSNFLTLKIRIWENCKQRHRVSLWISILLAGLLLSFQRKQIRWISRLITHLGKKIFGIPDFFIVFGCFHHK